MFDSYLPIEVYKMNWENILPPMLDTKQISDSELILFIKAWRNRQLEASDWTQLADSPVTNKADWIAYRRALRDLPKQGPDPKTWVLPEAP